MTADISPHVLRTTAPVLDCAARLFAEHGSRGMPMSDLTHRIAAATGVDTASLRRAFPTRFDLAFAVVLRSTRERVNGQLAADDVRACPTDRMSFLVRRHVQTGWEHRSATALREEILPVLRAIDPPRHRDITALTRTYREHVREIIVGGVVSGAFQVRHAGRAADDVLDTLDSVLHWYEPDGGLSLPDLATVYVDLVIHHHLKSPR
ncbi:TetR family transcriptional regulator [Nocardiopsis sp. Huas11]|uniref:TetR/AcrR family transcriptional regulator n=1 Tax=Nocardiopsis sp. Huas11 TaxID=2183912 RepID=UPI000EB22E08|nr:TetR/AcrR family transcriptional regulator [Nocardiopsis sp. Huas11]RKS09971.1 TetR family transcriptional regulator [Nocardiopsis sp. Huas11]